MDFLGTKTTIWIAACCAFSLLLGAATGKQKSLPPPSPLPAFALLQKVSLKLRGRAPSQQELAAFKQSISSHPKGLDGALTDVVQSYMDSRDFGRVMEVFHQSWWRLPPGSTTKLAAFIASRDEPYSQIFSKDYVLLDGPASEPYAIVGAQFEEAPPTAPDDWRRVRLTPAERRFRSVIGELDFLNKFPDTTSNQNRKRSNVVFQTFLCETLSAADIPDIPALKSRADPRADAEALLAAGDPHGSDPNCIGCHYRLDPLARFFDGWRPPYPGSILAVYDPDQKSSGVLVERNADGSVKRSPGQGDTDLAVLLSSSPNVHACIATKVWEFVQGTGVALDPEFRAELVVTYRQTDSLRSVVAAALKHPYFWSTERPPPINFSNVKREFDTCTTCHSKGGATKPDFDPKSYPFAASGPENVALLQRIFGAINRSAGFKAMPPLEAAALSPEALALIRQWIAAGAHDGNNQPSLNDDEIKEVLGE